MKKLRLKYFIFTIITLTWATIMFKQPAYGATGNIQFVMEPHMSFLTLGGQTTQSRDNSLRDLTISHGTLSPEFYSSTTRYSAIVPGDTDSIEVTATTSHPAAEIVSITGEDELSVGENTVQIVVEAQDGTQVIYQITITREEMEDETEINSKDSDEPKDVIDDGPIEVISQQDVLVESNSQLLSLQEKYDSDINVLFRIIVVLAVIGIILLMLLLALVSKNRGLSYELLKLDKDNKDSLSNKESSVLKESNNLKKLQNKDVKKEIDSDGDGDYYFEEVDE